MANPLSGVIPAVQLTLPEGWYLRSLTVNPVLRELEDGATSQLRMLRRTLSLAFRFGRSRLATPTVWLEFQIGSLAAKKYRAAPELQFTCSPSLFPSTFDTEAEMRRALPRSLAIINSVTNDVTSDALESAYGLGARLPDPKEHHPGNRRFVAVRRPFFRRFSRANPKLCYFTMAAWGGVSREKGAIRVKLKPMPIRADSRLPVGEGLQLGPNDTMSFWLPLPYPPLLLDLTADERRYLNLRVIWHRLPHRRIEMLAFPRVSGAFRLLHSTPAFRITPPLQEDPAPWDTGRSGKFVLDGAPVELSHSGKFEESLISLTVEDVEEIRTAFLVQIWVSVVAGAIAGGCASFAAEGVQGLQPLHRVIGVLFALVVCVAALLPLLPRHRQASSF